MRLRLYLSKPGAVESEEGGLRHVRRPGHASTFCGRFVPAGGWDVPAELDIELGDPMPAQLVRRMCLRCRSGLEEALPTVLMEG
jgi:hypothetical protein